jgi:hypothetical protein
MQSMMDHTPGDPTAAETELGKLRAELADLYARQDCADAVRAAELPPDLTARLLEWLYTSRPPSTERLSWS